MSDAGAGRVAGAVRAPRARGLSRALALALALGLAMGPGRSPAAGQVADSTPVDVEALSPADSAELLDEARAAQRDFEYLRRRYLPAHFGWGSRPCDDEVGRMCWTHETGSLWTPEPEDERITAARETLLAELAAVGAALPGDEWVLGQRVWYLLEAERAGRALHLARACGDAPPSWWCAALEGLVLHREARYPDAEEAFGRALAAMDTARAREWEDVRPLLDHGARGVLDDALERSPAEGRAVVERLWRLADPLHLVPGNERRTEHLARRTVIRIRSDARNPHGISWGDDLAELLIRYGWGVGWERVRPEPGRMGDMGGVIGHEHPESRAFMAGGDVLRDPVAAEAGPWEPRLEYAPSAYAPAYAPVVLPMDPQVAVLTRGDHARVAATWLLPPDTTRRGREGVRPEHRRPAAFVGEPAWAGLFLVAADGDTVHAVRAAADEGGGVLSLYVPAGTYWMSVEVLDPEIGRAGRYRRGLDLPRHPPDLAAVSDLLLLEPGPLPEDVDEALERLAADATVISGGSLVVAWELWGLGWREETVAYRLRLEGEGGGLFRRVGEALGLVGDDPPRSLEWEESGPDEPGAALRSVTMDLPEVEPGSYRLRLEVRTPGRTSLVTERRIEVVADPRR